MVAKLVDGGLPPSAQRGVVGIPFSILSGKPKLGGFGVLPVKEHIEGMHLALGSRYLSHLFAPSPDPPGQDFLHGGAAPQGTATSSRRHKGHKEHEGVKSKDVKT